MSKKEVSNARVHICANKTEQSGTNVLGVEQVKTFDFNGGLFRAVVEDGEPLFVANDVCRVLEYGNPREALSKHCKGVTKRDIPSAGGVQEVNVICEPDLYRLLFRSKKPEAEAFADFVYEEVLPSIRKTGQYTAKPQEIPNVAGLMPLLNGVTKSRFTLEDGSILTVIHSPGRRERHIVGEVTNKETCTESVLQYLIAHESGCYAFKDIRAELGIPHNTLSKAFYGSYGKKDCICKNGLMHDKAFRDSATILQKGARKYLEWNREAYQKAVQA